MDLRHVSGAVSAHVIRNVWELLSAWLRLLLTYHNPALVQHLDRVLPGWERMNDQVVDRAGVISKKESGEDKEEGGIIPLALLMGLYSTSMPYAHALTVMDWQVLQGEAYAGLYLVASLLDLYGTFLFHMTHTQIRSWMRDVRTGGDVWANSTTGGDGSCPPWFKSPELPATLAKTKRALVDSLTWDSFTEGWLAAAAAMRTHTPIGFRTDVQRTEAWALHMTRSRFAKLDQDRAAAQAASGGYPANTGNTANTSNTLSQAASRISSTSDSSSSASSTASSIWSAGLSSMKKMSVSLR